MLETALQTQPDPISHEIGRSELERAFRDCEARLGRPATNLEMCDELGLSLKDLYLSLDLCRGVGLGDMDDFVSEEGNPGAEAMVKYVPEPDLPERYFVCSKPEFHSHLARALDTLPRNEKLVISLHHNERLSMDEIAKIFGISATRVEQIHTTAVLRIRGKLQALTGI